MGDITVELHSGMTPEEWNRAMAKLEEFGFATRAEKKGEWIPVTERLPKRNVKVLTSDRNGNIWPCCLEKHTYGAFELYWYWELDDDWGTKRFKDITAWMPLPEPYKGE